MPRWIQDRVTHKLIPAEEYLPRVTAAPFIIQDSVDGFNATAGDGRYLDSKTKIRQFCKEFNLVMHEDCKGLPPQLARTEIKPDRVGVRNALLETMRDYK